MMHGSRGLFARPLPGLVLTFDAFGTLFEPKLPIAVQYAKVARDHGLRNIEEEDVKGSFEKAFKDESMKHPNYGKKVGMKPEEWWFNIITSTFASLTTKPIPPTLPKTLLQRFSSSEGYELCKDADTTLSKIHQLRHSAFNNGLFSYTVLGVISNSDHRVTSILESLGIPIRPYGSSGFAKESEATLDSNPSLNFVTLSYDVGFEKPRLEIFEAAKQTALGMVPESCRNRDWIFVHVGDDLRKDYHGAKEAGWKGILIDSDGKGKLEGVEQECVVSGLEGVYRLVEGWGMQRSQCRVLE